jgi:hypothetical protein
MRTHLTVMLTVLGFVGLIAPAAAHHGFETEYDNDKVISASGVVSKIEWTNPHMHVYVELTSPNAIQRLGWNKNDLVAGEKVSFKAHAGKVVESRAALDSLVKANAPKQEIFKGQRPEDLGSN